jgi:uncharacterized protein
MKAFGLEPRHIQSIKEILAKVFNYQEKVKVFIFGSRVKGNHREFSDIDLAIKATSKKIKDKIPHLQDLLVESNIPFKVDAVAWEDIAKEYFQEINKTKRYFWSSSEIDETTPWRICPLGQHWVCYHDRVSKLGTPHDVDGHCRLNPSRKNLLIADEIEIIPHNELFKKASRPSANDLNFKELGNKYDDLIAGWTAFWNDMFQPSEPLPPNVVKALMASESGFKLKGIGKNRRTHKVGPARGLIQITEESLKILKNHRGELKDFFIHLENNDLYDPNKNLCAGIRWLFHKRNLLVNRKKKSPTWRDVIIDYKGLAQQLARGGKKAEDTIKIFDEYLDSLEK